jgi:hypothetical protein
MAQTNVQVFSGNVGIGMNAPVAKLHIKTGTTLSSSIQSLRSNAAIRISAAGDNNDCMTFGLFDAVNGTGNNPTGYIQNSWDSDSDIGRLLVLNPRGGNVGIGFTNPGANLDILGSSGNPSTPTVHIGDNAADYGGGYGMVHLVRNPTESGTKAHLAFIRNGNSVFGQGFYNNTNTFGFWPSFGSVANVPAMSITTSGNVGIGTTNPGALFEVFGPNIGAGNGTTGILSRHISGEDGVLNIFGVQTGNGEEKVGLQMQIDGRAWQSDIDGGWTYGGDDRYALLLQPYKGYVGIGKTTPNCTLDLNNSTSQYNGIFSNRFWVASVGDNSGDGNPDDNTGSPWRGLGYDNLAWNDQNHKYSGDIPILSGYEGVALRSGAGNLLLTTAGNVGIGTTNPVAKLAIVTAGTQFTDLRLQSDLAYNNSTWVRSKCRIFFVGNAAFVNGDNQNNYGGYIQGGFRDGYNGGQNWSNAVLSFHTKIDPGYDIEAMTITNGGNVGIGTTSPGAKLHVEGSVYFNSPWSGSSSITKTEFTTATFFDCIPINTVTNFRGYKVQIRFDPSPGNPPYSACAYVDWFALGTNSVGPQYNEQSLLTTAHAPNGINHGMVVSGTMGGNVTVSGLRLRTASNYYTGTFVTRWYQVGSNS